MTTKSKEPKENINRRSKSFREKMRAKGFVAVFGWVPAEFKERVMALIKELRGK